MPSFSAARPANLSLDARHLLNVAAARRDHIGLSAGSFGISALAVAKASIIGLGVAPVASAAILMGLSAYAGINALRQARRVDREISQAAPSFSETPVPVYRILMPISALSKVVVQADAAAPSLVSALAERRARAWERVMEPGYQPEPLSPPRTPARKR